MIRLFLALACCVVPVSTLAEPVRVGAGEHANFTRIILEHPEMPQWQARRRGNAYRLTFASMSPLNFDLSNVFRLVDRSRVGDVRAIGGNSIEIDLVCNCDVRPSQKGQSALVVDIYSLQNVQPVMQADVGGMFPPAGAETSPSRPSMEEAAPSLSEPSAIYEPAPTTNPDQESPLAIEVAPADLAGQVSMELLGRALSRAAAQGLVTAEDDVISQQGATTLQQLRGLGGRQNLSVTTSFDRATKPDAVSPPPTDVGGQCLQDRLVDVASWGDARDLGTLGRLRGDAISEDGSVDADGAAKLARFYIHLGFGAEARIAAGYMADSRERDILLALAEIMDFGRSDAPVLRDQAACKGKVSLWSILAEPLSASSVPSSASSALAAFSALPSHLRTHLGPFLSERLHDVELREEARTAINAVTRGGIRTDESELASARLELEGTHAEQAREALVDLSNGTNLTAAAALLELFLDAEERGMPPNPAWVDDAPTLVGALEGTEIAERLNVAGLRGKIALGYFDEFRGALVEDSPGLTQGSRGELASLALRKVLESGSDTDFVKAEIGLAKIVPPENLDRDVRQALAERFLDLGLSQRGIAYIEEAPQSAAELETAVRVLLAAGRIENALSKLEESSFSGTANLRAHSFVAAGDDSSAVAAFLEAGDKESAASAAMRLAEWSWIAENTDSPVGAASRDLSAPIDELVPQIEGSNGVLIEKTRERRERIRSLLELTQPSTDPIAFTN